MRNAYSLLVTPDLTESDGTGPVPVGLLDTTSGRLVGSGLLGAGGDLARGLGGDCKSVYLEEKGKEGRIIHGCTIRQQVNEEEHDRGWVANDTQRRARSQDRKKTHAACEGPCHRWTCGLFAVQISVVLPETDQK